MVGHSKGILSVLLMPLSKGLAPMKQGRCIETTASPLPLEHESHGLPSRDSRLLPNALCRPHCSVTLHPGLGVKMKNRTGHELLALPIGSLAAACSVTTEHL